MRSLAFGLLLALAACGPRTMTPAQVNTAVNDETPRKPGPPGPISSNPPGDTSFNSLRCTSHGSNELECSRGTP